MKNLDILLAAAGGVVLGAAVGILFAPNKGTETRSQIADYVKTKCNKRRAKLEELVDRVEAELENE